MKVTALISDNLIDEVKAYAKGKSLTESLTIALEDWVNIQKLVELGHQIEQRPFEFNDGYSAEKIRKINRETE